MNVLHNIRGVVRISVIPGVNTPAMVCAYHKGHDLVNFDISNEDSSCHGSETCINQFFFDTLYMMKSSIPHQLKNRFEKKHGTCM